GAGAATLAVWSGWRERWRWPDRRVWPRIPNNSPDRSKHGPWDKSVPLSSPPMPRNTDDDSSPHQKRLDSTGLALDGAGASHIQHQFVGLADGGLEPDRALRRIDNVDHMFEPARD